MGRELLWQIIQEKLGVPAHIIQALRVLHDGMSVNACFRGKLGRQVLSTTGVRQGSIEGPVLWLLSIIV